MWIEKEPLIGDTVKVVFASFTDLGTQIGVLKYISIDGFRVVDFGGFVRFLDKYSNFFVYEK